MSIYDVICLIVGILVGCSFDILNFEDLVNHYIDTK